MDCFLVFHGVLDVVAYFLLLPRLRHHGIFLRNAAKLLLLGEFASAIFFELLLEELLVALDLHLLSNLLLLKTGLLQLNLEIAFAMICRMHLLLFFFGTEHLNAAMFMDHLKFLLLALLGILLLLELLLSQGVVLVDVLFGLRESDRRSAVHLGFDYKIK